MPQFDFDSQVASAEWLTQILNANGYLPAGSVELVGQEPIDAGASATIYHLEPAYSPDSTGTRPQSILMKVAKSGAKERFDEIEVLYAAWLLLPQSHRFSMLHKEPLFYDAVRHAAGTLPLVECYGAATDPVNHYTCLLLEDLRGTHGQPPWPIPPSDAQSEATVTALARLHANWWNSTTFGSEAFPVVTPQLVDEVSSVYADAYKRFEAMLGNRLTAARRAAYERSLDRLPALMKERLVGSSQLTLAHGDAHHWNVLLPKSDGRVLIFDWQTWHVDVGAHDLANLMALSWFGEHRALEEERLLRHYLSEINRQGVHYDWAALEFDYRLSIIRHLFTPVIFSSFIMPAVWWSHLDRIFCAFDDWRCFELLDRREGQS